MEFLNAGCVSMIVVVSPMKKNIAMALLSAFNVQQLLTVLRIKQKNHITSSMMWKIEVIAVLVVDVDICKDGDFVLNSECVTLPKTSRHSCDEHPLKLVYGDSNDYPLHHWCDICEKERDSKLWFYHCNASQMCFREYPFIKLSNKYKYKNH
ncbi:hypothetical protein Gogos_016444 [Gossypium gossypioides]|uniref:DC1 domain-containing protein n=1 Tax=Gossypium gossypioides TaxID=34282 RepID=A0A7J9B7Q5_GOSGO|nr:hypothetical protein [Gossypium gossypioides]